MENKLKDRLIKKPTLLEDDLDTKKLSVDVEPTPEPTPTPEEPSRPRIDDSFKEAISYFGPRLATLVLGGTEAMQSADKILSGYEQLQERRTAQQLAGQQAGIDQQRQREKDKREERSLQVREKGSKIRGKELKMAEKRILTDAGKYEKDTYNKYKKEFGSREDIKEYRKFAGVMDNIENMVEAGKKIPEASYALIARGLSGEVGVLTDKDITRSKVNQSILEQIRTGFYKTFKGTLAPEDRAEILKIARLVRERKNERFSNIATKQAKLDGETLTPKYQEMMKRNYLGQVYIFGDEPEAKPEESSEPKAEAGLSPEELKELQELEELEKQGKL